MATAYAHLSPPEARRIDVSGDDKQTVTLERIDAGDLTPPLDLTSVGSRVPGCHP
jgi:hypothetical protein